jgi:polyferredoxin
MYPNVPPGPGAGIAPCSRFGWMIATVRKKTHPKWRVFTLVSVHVLAAAHILHWSLKGKSLAPVEFSETLHTVHTGLINVGFLFMCAAVVCTFVFGRFFCGWGCHILALQDLSAWFLKRFFNIRPKPIKSRLLLWAPFGALAYMFAWPQVVRLWNGGAAPKLRVLPGTETWGSFTTYDLWRMMPGAAMAAFTFLVCGFAIVYILGSRSFCKYACPYGAIFRIVDKISLGKIVHAGGCEQCGLCTAACSTGIQVHQEIKAFNQVVDPLCLKCMDCVAACPSDALKFGFRKPRFFGSLKKAFSIKPKFTLTGREEIVLAASYAVFIAVYNGLYDVLPLLLSLAVAAVLGYGAVLAYRLAGGKSAALFRVELARDRRPTRGGWIFAVAYALLFLFTIHSAVVHYHAYVGRYYYGRLLALNHSDNPGAAEAAGAEALEHLEKAYRLGFYHSELMEQSLGSLFLRQGRVDLGAQFMASLLRRSPKNFEIRMKLAAIYHSQGRRGDEVDLLRGGLAIHRRGRRPVDGKISDAIAGRLALLQAPEDVAP